MNKVRGTRTAEWREKYGERHRLSRVSEFPTGVIAPEKVRLYARRDHFVLQWWDKGEQRTLNERVDGDLVAAISRAREIDQRLASFKTSGQKAGRFGHTTVVEKYLFDLDRRANAGEIDVATVARYTSALKQHYLPFVEQPSVSRRYRHVGAVDRDFQLEFAAFLSNRHVSPNGHANAQPRPLKHQAFIMDVARAMLEWAADPERGNLLSNGFRNPFSNRCKSRQVVHDPIADPDITIEMATDLISICDAFQLRVFAPLLLYGLRPGELGWLFHENLNKGWLRVACIVELDYTTKGRRDKRFPLVGCLKSLLQVSDRAGGLVHRCRPVDESRRTVRLAGKTLRELSSEFEQRCVRGGPDTAKRKRRIRDVLMKDAGQLTYDHVQAEFKKLSRMLKWPAESTLKDIRHLFSTCLENAGVPEFYRKYYMGHSFGKAPIVSYTHLTGDKVRQHYQRALESELASIVDAINSRHNEIVNGSLAACETVTS